MTHRKERGHGDAKPRCHGNASTHSPPPIIETILLIHTRMYAWRMQIRRPGLAMEALASPNCRLQIINRSPLIFSVCVCVCVCVCFFLVNLARYVWHAELRKKCYLYRRTTSTLLMNTGVTTSSIDRGTCH